MRYASLRCAVAAIMLATSNPALATPITVTKTALVVSDPVGSIAPNRCPARWSITA